MSRVTLETSWNHENFWKSVVTSSENHDSEVLRSSQIDLNKNGKRTTLPQMWKMTNAPKNSWPSHYFFPIDVADSPVLSSFCPSVCPVCQFISAYYPIPGSHSWFPRPPMPTRKLDMGRHRSPQGMQCNSLYRQFVTVESNKTIRPYESHKLGTYASASGFLKGIVDPNCFCGPSFEGWKIDNDIPFTSNNSLRSAVQLQCSTYKHPDKSNQQTRMQSRKTLLWNKLFQQSCTFFPCHRTV